MKKSVKRLLLEWKYPKLMLLTVSILLAYLLFSNAAVKSSLQSHDPGVLTLFIMGYLFSFGFSTPFSIGFFLSLPPGTPGIIALVGGFGAMLADLTIFGLIRISFKDEFNKLKSEKMIKKMNGMKRVIPKKVRLYLLYALAGFVIASPLPDELGVAMIAGLTKIKPNVMAGLSFLLNTAGIWIIIELGKVI